MVQQLSHAPEPQASKEEEACCQSQGEPAPVWNLHTEQISIVAYSMLLIRHLYLVQSIQCIRAELRHTLYVDLHRVLLS